MGFARVGAAELRATASSSCWYSNLNFYSSNDNNVNYTWNAGSVLKGSTNSVQRYLDFFGPRWNSPNSLMPFHRAQKKSQFPGPVPLPTCPYKWICTYQIHYVRGRMNHSCINTYKDTYESVCTYNYSPHFSFNYVWKGLNIDRFNH